MKYLFTLASGNRKTGPIPVVHSSPRTCPPSCPQADGGCYAKHGNVGMHWRRVDSSGMDAGELASRIARLPRNALWRYGVAGDLPGEGEAIDAVELMAIVGASAGTRGFGYTHKLTPDALDIVAMVNRGSGLTINLSADSPTEADALAMLGVGPVVTVLPRTDIPVRTPGGRRIVVCPAVTHSNVTCASCALCAVKHRAVIVGFPAHGSGAKRAEARARVIPIKEAA